MSEKYLIIERLVKNGLVGEESKKLAEELLDEFEHLSAVRELQRAQSPQEYKNDLQDMFNAFLQSDWADDKFERTKKLAVYNYLVDFFSSLGKKDTGENIE